MKKVRDLINNNNIDGGLFDCGLSTESDVKHTCAIQELALFNMASTSSKGKEGKKNHRYGLLGEEKSISAGKSGIAKNSDEVLILNKIPKGAIVAILSPLEIELLSVVDNAYFGQAIQDIKDKKISITLAPSELVVSRKNVASKTFPINSSVHTALEKTCVDAAYGEYSANPKLDFSKCFENIKTAKDKIIDGAVNYLNWSIDVNKKHLGHSLRVLDITESLKKEVTAIKKIDEADIYDILAIKLGNEVFMYNNIDLIKEFGLNK